MSSAAPMTNEDRRGWIMEHPAHGRVEIVDADAGIVKEWGPDGMPRKKVAIVGFASSTMLKAPFEDPAWSVWGMNQLYRMIPRFDRWFETHQRDVFLADVVRDTNYLGWLQHAPVPVYMLQRHADIPNSVRYPIEAMIQLLGRRYFTSSVSYMVALALAEGAETIGLWGIDLIVGTEYDYQKACVEYLLGIAHARGVEVIIPPESALLKSLTLYGYEPVYQAGPFTLEKFDKRMQNLLAKRNELLTQVNAVEGAIQETQSYRNILDLHLKGGTVVWDV